MIAAFIQAFDWMLSGAILLSPRKRVVIIQELLKEAELFGEWQEGKQQTNAKVISHLVTLTNLNQARAAASISHTSLMLTALIFSYNFIFKCAPMLQKFILSEVVLYLLIAVSLLRVVRHFGVQKPIFGSEEREPASEAKKFMEATLNELALKYQILHVTNFALIIGAIAFGASLVFHLAST